MWFVSIFPLVHSVQHYFVEENLKINLSITQRVARNMNVPLTISTSGSCLLERVIQQWGQNTIWLCDPKPPNLCVAGTSQTMQRRTTWSCLPFGFFGTAQEYPPPKNAIGCWQQVTCIIAPDLAMAPSVLVLYPWVECSMFYTWMSRLVVQLYR